MPDKDKPGDTDRGDVTHAAIRTADDGTKIVTLPGVSRSDQTDPDQAGKHFRPLGYDKGQFFFITTRGKQVLQFKAGHLSIKANLYMLAPMQWWEREFPSEKGFSGKAVDQAVNYLINECYGSGAFRLDRLRGRGAWWDRDQAVIHAGNRLIVDGSSVPLTEFDSSYVYEAFPALPIEMSNPLSADEARDLLKFSRSLNWEQEIHATLFAGWAVVALVCGAIPWRPHIIITGQSGGGKSWVVEKLYRLLGEFAVFAKGDSSEAGLRQQLKHDALPVLWDEAEGDDNRSEANVNKVLGLMRQASAEIGGQLYKGGQDGTSASYTIRSTFCLSAIRIPMQQTADENRVTVLTLNPNKNADQFKSVIVPLASRITNYEWTSRFRARVIAHLPDLRANIETFATAAGQFFVSQRMGDQIAPMLAGAYLLHSGGRISIDDALAWMDTKKWPDQTRINEESDEGKMLAALLESVIRVPLDRGSIDLSIGEIIKNTRQSFGGAQIDASTAHQTLARHGILVEPDWVVVSNTHRGIKKLLRETSWSVGWGPILRRITGAKATTDKRSFAGAQSRGIRIPMTKFPP